MIEAFRHCTDRERYHNLEEAGQHDMGKQAVDLKIVDQRICEPESGPVEQRHPRLFR